MTPDQIEARKKLASLRLGGFIIGATIWVISLPVLSPWVWPPLLLAAFVTVSAAASTIYDRVVLDKPIKRWMWITPVVVASIFTGGAIVDGVLRQAFRAGDCMRWESEMVMGLPGERADAASAFQALKCTPSGGIVERLAGTPRSKEAAIRTSRENEKRAKEGLPPLE